MFSSKRRRPNTPELLECWELLDAGDVPGALRRLRAGAETLPLAEMALVVRRAAEAAGFDDLGSAAGTLAGAPRSGLALHRFGYACAERGPPWMSVPALREALRLNPDLLAVVRELVAAYERQGRHREATDLLMRYEDRFQEWPDGHLLVVNALMAGDLAPARDRAEVLPDPVDPRWAPARERQRRMLARAASVARTSALDATDLRGWQFVLGGTVLGTLSPFGFEAGMNGRYAWLQDTYGQCLRGLLRLGALLESAGVAPRSVSLLPDRGSQVLGLAAADVLGLPARPFEPGRQDTVVVAYDLNRLTARRGGPELRRRLFRRVPGQVLHEHASSWSDAPAVTADSVGLLHQSVVPPWDGRLRHGAGGGVRRTPPDDRPAGAVAAGISAADPAPDSGDGEGPDDPAEHFARFVTAVRDCWLRGDRERLDSSGPVPSSRFV
ncbi:tetratricopeptide repeat protein [Streptomyces sp. NBC_01497]|uniref:tetratricopeptide repeat protein n=1 Tax=Streptomyces sp. NBC_01497 TaxID=2903885 RepID=UPI002E36C482|nr:hypothetical protein [Streptomyces sp. NBC_01497]